MRSTVIRLSVALVGLTAASQAFAGVQLTVENKQMDSGGVTTTTPSCGCC